MYRDKYGLIVQANGDGGDTAQRMGMWGFADVVENNYDPDAIAHLKATLQLEIKPGVFVRHPFQKGFQWDPKEFSRDQQDALVMYLAERRPESAWCAFKNQVKRFGRYQNKDWANLATISVYIRALKLWWLWPLLFITDLHYIAGPLLAYPSQKRNPDDVDDINAILRMLQSTYRYPTLTAWIGRKLYVKIRPENNGARMYTVCGALFWYFRASAGGNEEFARRYWPLVKFRF
jgi:hypothetical protein